MSGRLFRVLATALTAVCVLCFAAGAASAATGRHTHRPLDVRRGLGDDRGRQLRRQQATDASERSRLGAPGSSDRTRWRPRQPAVRPDAGPVIDTTQSFTVSAWVDLDNTNGYQTFVSQDGVAPGERRPTSAASSSSCAPTRTSSHSRCPTTTRRPRPLSSRPTRMSSRSPTSGTCSPASTTPRRGPRRCTSTAPSPRPCTGCRIGRRPGRWRSGARCSTATPTSSPAGSMTSGPTRARSAMPRSRRSPGRVSWSSTPPRRGRRPTRHSSASSSRTSATRPTGACTRS